MEQLNILGKILERITMCLTRLGNVWLRTQAKDFQQVIVEEGRWRLRVRSSIREKYESCK